MKNSRGVWASIAMIGAMVCVPQWAQAGSDDSAASAPDSAQSPARSPEQIHVQPGVPRSSQPALSGRALDAHVLTQLKQRFDAADTDHTGRISVDQARSAGWGYLVNHFGQIDKAGRGTVSFDEIANYMRGMGARM
ncbi:MULTISPECIES: EF-hand domain-containing protein [Paraburkholderia]|uniref:EF-hand domain-containing protein n=1 Tax=Paraburkholderia TaxID=1822464 RepID=UPI0022531C96|nr:MULTISPECIES: EF-hand domain-containing protein [Paraburkholderia]MCX4161812.1 EF-hand domain-containing protein [Paraburkholderia megapolitana]MDN7157309.1 EF-hand domain-containing protein [Paraburkholderia sp. CHISQ3]MDQ6494354.1 EF-hand domain-containing protein [Paraburkholderia megapolitana]